MADVEGEAGVLLDHQHRQPLLAVEVAEPGEQLAGHQRGQAQRRLVEQQQAGPGHHRPGQGQHLLLAAAHAAGLLPPALAQPREDLVPTVQVGVDLAVVAVDRPDAHVLVDGQLGEGAPPLGHVGDAQLGDGLGRLADDRPAVETDVARDRDHAADRSQGGCLPGAVGPEHHRDVPEVDRQVDAVQHLHLTVAPGHPLHLEQAHAGAPR
jgi:hypothetical protein